MAYFVGKVLKISPHDIMREWSCQELLVTYGEYANQRSMDYYDSLTQAQRNKHRPKPLRPIDRYAIPFISLEEIAKLNEQASAQPANKLNLQDVADYFNGI